MSIYMKYSTRIYNTYLKYISADDIYVYSIDEIFCDLTSYLNTYRLTAKELVTRMIRDLYGTKVITDTEGNVTKIIREFEKALVKDSKSIEYLLCERLQHALLRMKNYYIKFLE